MRFLGYTLADPSTPIPEPTPEMYAKMGEFVAEATKGRGGAGHRRPGAV